jgi:hypothetical protein
MSMMNVRLNARNRAKTKDSDKKFVSLQAHNFFFLRQYLMLQDPTRCHFWRPDVDKLQPRVLKAPTNWKNPKNKFKLNSVHSFLKDLIIRILKKY